MNLPDYRLHKFLPLGFSSVNPTLFVLILINQFPFSKQNNYIYSGLLYPVLIHILSYLEQEKRHSQSQHNPAMKLSIIFKPVAQMVKNLPVMQKTWVQSLGWEEPLEKGMAIHSSILTLKIPWTEEPGYSPWGCKELDMTERLTLLQHLKKEKN